VDASVAVFADEKAAIDERLSQCLSAKPQDPCADAQKARDRAVAGYNDIPSPAEDAPYAEFQKYFAKRDEAYAKYQKAKGALEECRAANPPKAEVPYGQSDTKACFDGYDASVEAIRTTFTQNTQAMRTALTKALAALDAREKACNPPTGTDKFTDLSRTGAGNGDAVAELMSCRPLSAELDLELFLLRKRAAALPAEIQAVETSIENVEKRMSPLRRDLADVDTYIPPESTRTQYEGALNALRAERKVAIESSLEFYKNLLARKQAEKEALEAELEEVEAQIKARMEEIARENAERRAKFPTDLRLASPDECGYYHCHGMLCGIADPAPHGCGHGATTENDLRCEEFLDAYLDAAGAK
jgi:hypothetical protein